MDRPQLVVIVDGGGGNGDGNVEKSPNSGGREAFVGGVGMRDNICISGSAVVNREDQCWRGPCQRSGATWS